MNHTASVGRHSGPQHEGPLQVNFKTGPSPLSAQCSKLWWQTSSPTMTQKVPEKLEYFLFFWLAKPPWGKWNTAHMAHRPGPVFLGIVSLTLCGARQLCGSWMPCFWAKDKNMQKVPVRAIVLVRMSNPTCYVSLWHKLTWFNLWAILKRSMWAILTIWAILSHIYIYTLSILYLLDIIYYLGHTHVNLCGQWPNHCMTGPPGTGTSAPLESRPVPACWAKAKQAHTFKHTHNLMETNNDCPWRILWHVLEGQWPKDAIGFIVNNPIMIIMGILWVYRSGYEMLTRQPVDHW